VPGYRPTGNRASPRRDGDDLGCSSAINPVATVAKLWAKRGGLVKGPYRLARSHFPMTETRGGAPAAAARADSAAIGSWAGVGVTLGRAPR